MRTRRILVNLAIACIGTLVLIGLITDLGRVYCERRRAAQAIDIALIAAANELPLENAAHESALMYLHKHLFDDQSWENVRVVTNAGDATQVISGSSEANAILTIWIDTAFSRDLDAKEPINTANRMRLSVRQEATTTFLRFVGVKQITIENSAEAWIWPNQTVTVISDVSNSTKFLSLCLGCWKEGCAYRSCWTQCGVEDAPKNCRQGELGSIVLASLDRIQASDVTNVIEGMRRGIAVSSSEKGSGWQSRATHIMILVTDRNLDVIPGDEPQGQECWRENLWTGDKHKDEKEQQAADCAIYYARKAEANGIFIYTVGLGSQTDQALMEKIASIAGGYHHRASAPDELDGILDDFFYTGGSRLTR